MAAPSADFGRRSDSGLEDHLSGWSRDGLLLSGRVLMALIFVSSGFAKVMDVGTFSASLASKSVPFAPALAIIGAAVEFLGGLAVLLGFQTRYSALLLAAFTIIATAISHRYWEFSAAARHAQEVNFMKNVCITGGFLLLAAAGGGRFSIDTLWRRREGRLGS